MKVSDIPKGQGWTGQMNGQNVAIFNKGSDLVVLENVCTHLRCQTNWNSEEQTWDCPCHGSKFKAEGDVLRGPARRPLSRLTYKIQNDEITLEEIA